MTSKIMLIIIGLFIFNCTEKLETKVHPDEWNHEEGIEASSENFHGLALHSGWDGIENCKSCHGNKFNGGTSEISCFSCHKGGPNGHPKSIDFLSSTYDDFHGNFIAEDRLEELEHCKICHGEDLDGGNAGVSCAMCHENLFN